MQNKQQEKPDRSRANKNTTGPTSRSCASVAHEQFRFGEAVKTPGITSSTKRWRDKKKGCDQGTLV
jgi:hypothetical protein